MKSWNNTQNNCPYHNDFRGDQVGRNCITPPKTNRRFANFRTLKRSYEKDDNLHHGLVNLAPIRVQNKAKLLGQKLVQEYEIKDQVLLPQHEFYKSEGL